MGYDVHVTRKKDWSDKSGEEISLTEWLAHVEGDPELRLDGYAEAGLGNGGVLHVDDPSMAVWIAHPEHGVRDGMAWIWLSHGNLQAKNPDGPMLKKLWDIAQLLDAKVQGDDGELYDSAGSIISDEVDADTVVSVSEQPQPRQKPWWRIW